MAITPIIAPTEDSTSADTLFVVAGKINDNEAFLNAKIGTEITDRTNADLLALLLDGSRSMTGDLEIAVAGFASAVIKSEVGIYTFKNESDITTGIITKNNSVGEGSLTIVNYDNVGDLVGYIVLDSSGGIAGNDFIPSSDLEFANVRYVKAYSIGLSETTVQEMSSELVLPDATLSEINESINSNSVVNVFIYDTSTDDDGGAWVEEANWQSWYHETLDTSTRGGTRQFPKVAIIVLELDTVTIYDGTKQDHPMWMEFSVGGTWNSWTDNTFKMMLDALNVDNVFFKNNKLYIGKSSGFITIDFINDIGYAQTGTEAKIYGSNIKDRNNNFGYEIDYGNTIIYSTVNDVAVTSDGKGSNIVYISTDLGVSRILPDGSTSNWTDGASSSILSSKISIIDERVYWTANINSTQINLLQQETALSIEDTETYNSDRFTGSYTIDWSEKDIPIHDGVGYFSVQGISKNSIATDKWLSKFYQNYDDFGRSMIANIDISFYSGLLHGDIRGAFLANSKTDDRSYKNILLTETGTITESVVATGSDLKCYSGFTSANYLQQAYVSSFNFGLNEDFYVCAWIRIPNNQDYKTIFQRGESPENNSNQLLIDTGVDEKMRFLVGTASLSVSTLLPDDKWAFFCFYRESDILKSFINGTFEIGGSGARDLTSASAVLRIGERVVSAGTHFTGDISLLRIGSGAPNEDQIKKIYELEKPLFSENIKCTLQGSSSNVLTVDYDPLTNITTACTANYITMLNDFVVVDSTNEIATSISTINDKMVTGV